MAERHDDYPATELPDEGGRTLTNMLAKVVKNKRFATTVLIGAALIGAALASSALLGRGTGPASRSGSERRSKPPTPPPSAGRIVATIAVGLRPGSIVAGEGAVWVKNHADQTVSRIDPETNTVTATIPIGAGEFGYLAAGEGSVWATNNDANTVSRIDPRTNAVQATIPVGENPQGIAVGSGSVWVANHRAGSVSRIDPETNRVSEVIVNYELCCSPQAVATSPGAVWVTVPDPGKQHLVRIDPATNRVIATVAVGESGGRLAVGEDAVWAATNTRTVAKIDPATNSVVSRVDADAIVFGATAGLGSIWVTSPGESLVRIDPAGNRVGELRIRGAVFPTVGTTAVWVSSETTNSVVRVEPLP